MSWRPQGSSPMSIREEESILAHSTENNVRAMLSDPRVVLPSSKAQIRAQTAVYAKRLYQLDARRRQPHGLDLIDALSKTRAMYILLQSRLFRINEFPVEILQRIFLLATASLSMSEVSQSRVRLTSVCSYWRAIAINLPKLWSVIIISTRPPFPLLHLCRQRAKACPIVVIIDQQDRNWSGSETDQRISPDDMRALMLSVASFLDQVTQLLILTDTWAVTSAAVNVLQSVPPPRSLQKLEIHRAGDTYVQFPPTAPIPPGLSIPCRLFGGAHAPRLNHLVFDGINVDFSRSSFRHLRVFEMRKMPVELMPSLANFLPVLQGSPHLERLVFDGACPQLSDPRVDRMGSNWQPVQLAHLRELIISNLVPDYAAYVVQLFSAPRLKRLTLERLLGEDFTSFIEKLIGRFPKVTLLTVDGLGTGNTQVLAAWLRTMPVRYLRVARVGDEFFNALLVRAPPFPDGQSRREQHWCLVCPHLEICEILAWPSVRFEAFKKFYAGRRDTLRGILIGERYLNAMNTTEKTWLSSTNILRRVPPLARPDLDPRYG